MATITNDLPSRQQVSAANIDTALRKALQALGSLKLTVALFALSLVIVLVGTLAQDEMNMLDVKQRYFLSWIAPLHLDDFVPQAFYKHDTPFPGVIPFPGGALIGTLLMVNLIAAKITRFQIHARGIRLAAGIGFLIAGAAVAALVIVAGHSSDGLQGTPPIAYDTLWKFVLAGTTVLGLAAGAFAARIPNSTVRSIAFAGAAICLGFVIYAVATGFRVGDPGLRIVWQLTKGLGAGLIMLVGCKLIFDQKGGNMLLHIGVALMMVGQFTYGDRQTEQRLNLVEGQSTNTFVNMDRLELAFTRSDQGTEQVVAIPGSRLQAAAGGQDTISDSALPTDVRVLRYFENSSLGKPTPENIATAGLGKEYQAFEKEKVGGTESDVNVASAYVELIDKSSGDSLGKYLISQYFSDRTVLFDPTTNNAVETVAIGDQQFEIGLKFHREVKPYWVQLQDVRQINYSGTSTPRDYSSFIHIIENETGKETKERVWMNNPLRFQGETFYQSNYQALPGGKEWTSIQVVRNSGWLIPYVACSITGIGLLAHFLGTLGRFLRRRERETRTELAATDGQRQPGVKSRAPVMATVATFAALAGMMLIPWSAVMNRFRPDSRMEDFDWYSAGKIPTQFGGRLMPLDAFAGQTLKAISNKSSLPLDTAPTAIKDRVDGKKLSALQWLMEVAIDEPSLEYLPMIRVDAEEVRSELGIERRESKLYSLAEIRNNAAGADELIQAARAKEPRERSFKERKLVELSSRVMQYQLAAESFRLPSPPDISVDQFKQMFPDQDPANIPMVAMRMLQRRMDFIKDAETPAIVAPTQSEASEAVHEPRWLPFAPAFVDHAGQVVLEKSDAPPRPGVESFGNLIKAYADGDALAFNTAVDQHLAAVGAYPIPGYRPPMISLERWMQSNWPTGVAMFLYMACLGLGLVYLLADLPRLRSATWGILTVAIAIHTVAILCRIAITGRAPVINLYSASVFIGWAAVLFGLIVERIFRRGAGNMLAATAGMLSLLVAYGLNTGDTMPVLQAVLDTQFWLATHVITVTLGYSATMVAGTVGIGYLIAGWFGAEQKMLHNLYRVCYGAACFGILFSFIGTVLGGLWADDSWGRFWGWDPKENGALLIVIWNALMLHARWDGMVGPRGFATLAIGGNIVTAWSYFGTNELGIGLHSYGFTEGVLMYLSLFIVSQLAVVALDMIHRRTGWRFGPPPAGA